MYQKWLCFVEIWIFQKYFCENYRVFEFENDKNQAKIMKILIIFENTMYSQESQVSWLFLYLFHKISAKTKLSNIFRVKFEYEKKPFCLSQNQKIRKKSFRIALILMWKQLVVVFSVFVKLSSLIKLKI